jgi:competence protein ComEC
VLVWWALVPGAGPRARAEAEVVLFDVGQGDAILLRDSRSRILVDGGGTAGGDMAQRALLPGLQSVGVRRLDVAVLSHPDRDHCLGLLELSRFLAIGELWVPAIPPHGDCAGELLERFAGRTRRLAAGDALAMGGWWFEVLHPKRAPAGRGNRDSLVLRASRSGVAVLLTGDIDAAAEAALVESYGVALRSELLKVPHHGSRTSSSVSLLESVGARVALVSAGVRNPYGHPSSEVLARYRSRSTVVLRTDRHGRITVSWSDDGSLRLETTGR